MRRLLRMLAIAAASCLLVASLPGCDLSEVLDKSGVAPNVTKHRFGPEFKPRLDVISDRGDIFTDWLCGLDD